MGQYGDVVVAAIGERCGKGEVAVAVCTDRQIITGVILQGEAGAFQIGSCTTDGEGVGLTGDADPNDVTPFEGAIAIVDATGLAEVLGVCQYAYAVVAAIGQCGGEGEVAIGINFQVIAIVVLQDKPCAFKPGDGAAEGVCAGVVLIGSTIDDNAFGISAFQQPLAVGNRTNLVRVTGLDQYGHVVAFIIRVGLGKLEGAIGADSKFVLTFVLQYEPAAKKPGDGSADFVSV